MVVNFCVLWNEDKWSWQDWGSLAIGKPRGEVFLFRERGGRRAVKEKPQNLQGVLKK